MNLDAIFKYHAPNENQRDRYVTLRAAAKTFAETIVVCTPAGEDQNSAIRKVREAVMTANAAIALENT